MSFCPFKLMKEPALISPVETDFKNGSSKARAAPHDPRECEMRACQWWIDEVNIGPQGQPQLTGRGNCVIVWNFQKAASQDVAAQLLVQLTLKKEKLAISPSGGIIEATQQ